MEKTMINQLIVQNYDYFRSVCRFYYPNSKDNAEDLLNDAMIRILDNADKFEEGTNFRGWCCFIIRNLFINDYRKMVKNSCFCVEDFAPYDNRTTSYFADEDSLCKDIYVQYNKLDQIYKDCLYLWMNGYKYEEISQMLQVSLGTVKSRIFFGRDKLKQKLEYKNYDKEKCRKNL